MADASSFTSWAAGKTSSISDYYRIFILDGQADKLDPERLYRDIMSIDFQHSKDLTLIQPNQPDLNQHHRSHAKPLHPSLACIIEETLRICQNNEFIKQASKDKNTVRFQSIRRSRVTEGT